MYYCRKTDRYFDGNQALINHIRKVYDTIEEGYLQEHNIDSPPICKYCNKNKCIFISYFKGYEKRCGDYNCIKEAYRGAANKRKINKIKKSERIDHEFRCFIKENFYFYSRNKSKRFIIDPFANKNIGNITIKAYISRNLKNTGIESRMCKYCGKIFKTHILEDREYCEDKQCVSMYWNWFGSSDLILRSDKDINNFFQWLKYYKGIEWKDAFNRIKEHIIDMNLLDSILGKWYIKLDKIWVCPETGWIVPIVKKRESLPKYLLSIGIDIKEYYLKWLPEYISHCWYCGKFIKYSKDLINEPNKKYCCNKCYYKDQKGKPKSKEEKEKQSKVMLDLIKSGKFTPNTNNTWNGEILEFNGTRYRSSWELVFHYLNSNLSYETMKIKYYCTLTNKIRTYIVDFVDYEDRILYEVKPKINTTNQNVLDKEKYAIQWCKENNYEFKYITESWFVKNVNKKIIEEIPEKAKKRIEGVLNEKG